MSRLLLALGPSTGGIGGHVRQLADGFVARDWDVRVAGPADLREGAMAGLGERFVPVSLPGRWADAPAAAKALRPLLAETDVCHVHGLRAGVVVTRRARAPVVASLHNLVLPETAGRAWRLARRAEPWLGRHADRAVGASPDITARLGPGAVTVTCALDPPVPARRREDVRADLGIAPDAVVALCAARLHPQKRLGDLVRAAARVGADTIEVLLAGDGPDREKLSALVAETAAPVRLLGARRDVADLAAAADVAVLSSAWEAVALFLQEAAWAGLPLVGTRTGGIPLLVEPRRTGVLVDVGDVAGLADALAGLARDAGERARLGAGARAKVAADFTVAAMLDRFEVVYREVLQK